MAGLQTLFEPINQYFDHIYVITLKRATERHQKIQQDLAGLNFSFFEATDYKDFSVADLIQQKVYDPEKAKAVQRYGKAPKGGVLACSLSHKRVYEDVVKNNYSKVLICEDDVIPLPDGLKIFPLLLHELPPDWGMVLLDYNKNTNYGIFPFLKQQVYHLQKMFSHFPWSHKTIQNLYARKYSTHLMKAGYHDYTSAYAITKNTAAIFLQYQTPVIFYADHLLAHVSSNELVKSFISMPKLFQQLSQTQKEKTGSYVEEA